MFECEWAKIQADGGLSETISIKLKPQNHEIVVEWSRLRSLDGPNGLARHFFEQGRECAASAYRLVLFSVMEACNMQVQWDQMDAYLDIVAEEERTYRVAAEARVSELETELHEATTRLDELRSALSRLGVPTTKDRAESRAKDTAARREEHRHMCRTNAHYKASVDVLVRHGWTLDDFIDNNAKTVMACAMDPQRWAKPR